MQQNLFEKSTSDWGWVRDVSGQERTPARDFLYAGSRINLGI